MSYFEYNLTAYYQKYQMKFNCLNLLQNGIMDRLISIILGNIV